MKVLLQNLKDMVAAEKAAKLGKKVKKAKAKKPKVSLLYCYALFSS
jgi:hypothetical protein